mgnify:CR=1 FL=1|tara:strand:- start:6926 stop:7366 length:441 start_codon:yes stop_codon:yes gene_type:complete
MPTELVSNIIVIAIALGFLASLKLPNKPKYFLYGFVLMAIGAFRLLNYYDIMSYDIPKLPIVSYAVSAVALVVGGGLLLESISERSIIRWSSFLLGAAIVLLAVIPTLYDLNAITFNIPSYPQVINFYLHVSAGLLLLIGVFVANK